MFRLVYLSTACTPFTSADLAELLRLAREHNQRHEITGMLLYRDSNFIQILEGPEQAVRDLYQQHIARDPRHGDLQLVLEEETDNRLFDQWSMGFRDLNDPQIHELSGYSQFMNDSWSNIKTRLDGAGYIALLKLFRQGRIGM